MQKTINNRFIWDNSIFCEIHSELINKLDSELKIIFNELDPTLKNELLTILFNEINNELLELNIELASEIGNEYGGRNEFHEHIIWGI
jgi:hypothetical protein